MTIPVTALVTTRNEELNIEKCLGSIHGLVDQIFVIDSESRDATVTIASRYADHVQSLPYVHGKIIPWIFQWGLDNLPIRNEWVLILEADQAITIELRHELQELFARDRIQENGFYIRRRQIFRGRWIRFGGYGSKYLLKLFRRRYARLDEHEEDTRVYVEGRVGKLRHPLEEENLKEAEILFYLEKHLRYADAFAREELRRRRRGTGWLTHATPFGTPDQRVLWLKGIYYRLPLYVRPFLYYLYRYVFRLGFLDGKEGAVFHFLQAFWFRLVVDIRLGELLKTPDPDPAPAQASPSAQSAAPPTLTADEALRQGDGPRPSSAEGR